MIDDKEVWSQSTFHCLQLTEEKEKAEAQLLHVRRDEIEQD